jgi:asparagine synthase (glutamine-hydrolysing)
VEAYWRLESREHRDSLDETVAHVRALLSAAVERQLVSDVPVGLLLSGGLDSSGIVALATAARRRAGAPLLDAFTLDLVGQAEHFEETILRRDLDLPWAKRVAEHTGAPLRLVTIDPDELVDRALEPMRAYDRPASGEIDTSMLVMFKRLKKEATVILSGESADEVFGGYPWFYVDEFVGHEGFPWARDDDRATLLAPAVRAAVRPEEHLRESYRALMAEVPRLPGESPREARSREIFYMNLKRFLCFLLDRKDRMSMAASVEVRVPFCDHLLVEYMWNVPWSMKYADGIEKGLLRRALAHVLPEDVRRRRKTAYPVAHAPAYMKGVRAEMRRILDDPGSKLTPLLDRAAVERLLQGDGKERSERALTGIDTHLEYLIQMHHWMKEYRVSIKL